MEGIVKLSIAVGVAFVIGLGVMWVTDRIAAPTVVAAPAGKVVPPKAEEFNGERKMSPEDLADMKRLLAMDREEKEKARLRAEAKRASAPLTEEEQCNSVAGLKWIPAANTCVPWPPRK